MTGSIVAQLEAVTQRYGEVTALAETTLRIPTGLLASLIGPDGAGKSTLLAIVAGAPTRAIR